MVMTMFAISILFELLFISLEVANTFDILSMGQIPEHFDNAVRIPSIKEVSHLVEHLPTHLRVGVLADIQVYNLIEL